MSLIYRVLKPVLRKATVKKSDMTREDFVRQAEKLQQRSYTFPEIAGYEKQEYTIAGYEKQEYTIAGCSVLYIQSMTVITVVQSYIMPAADI